LIAPRHERLHIAGGKTRSQGSILQVGIQKGEKKLCTVNIGQSMEQFLAWPGSRKGGVRAVRVGGRLSDQTAASEEIVSGGGDPES